MRVEHRVVDAVAFQAAVTQDLPALHAGEDVLDAGSDLAVGGVVFLFPVLELALTGLATVRDDQAGASVAAVSDHYGGYRGTGLVIRGVPIVLRLLGVGVVTGGNQGAVHEQHSVPAEPVARLECERRCKVVDDAAGCRFRDPEQSFPGVSLPHWVQGNPGTVPWGGWERNRRSSASAVELSADATRAADHPAAQARPAAPRRRPPLPASR
ncbi:hypothetical protein TUSST3_56540 [Streptomyces sp. TUS-ST3]|nr:hypothetical protein TUSST3_56540 [Streptomyces sp. TUS-ST3]